MDLLQRLARFYLGPNAEFPPAAMRNTPGYITRITLTVSPGSVRGMHKAPSKDATAAFEPEGMHTPHEVNGPRLAHTIMTAEDLWAVPPC